MIERGIRRKVNSGKLGEKKREKGKEGDVLTNRKDATKDPEAQQNYFT